MRLPLSTYDTAGGGDRCALALISLALDEVDATGWCAVSLVVDRRVGGLLGPDGERRRCRRVSANRGEAIVTGASGRG